MNPIHAHLMLNHIPVLGTAFAAALLAYAMLRGQESFKRLAYACMIIFAALAPFVFLSGRTAEHRIERLAIVPDKAVHAHEEAGEGAFAAVEILGLAALAQMILYMFPAAARLRGRTAYAVMLGALVTFAMLAWAADLGGKIRHGQELGSDGAAPFSVP